MNPNPLSPSRRFAAVLRDTDFRWFYAGYATSNVGSALAPVAIAFAVLDTGHGATGFGLVMGARILPVVLLLLVGGVFADRLGGRRVMIAADLLRTVAQGLLAALFLLSTPSLWTMCVLAALTGIGEGVFAPSLQALIPQVVGAERLADANLLLNATRSAAGITGPLLGGVLVALTSPAAAVAADAASYLVSVAALLRLPHTRRQPMPQNSMIGDLSAGWSEFRSRTWLWATSLQFGLFNALVWAPFLVLGPLAAKQHFGGAGPLASAFGLGRFLAFGAVFQVISVLFLLALPSVRHLPAYPPVPTAAATRAEDQTEPCSVS